MKKHWRDNREQYLLGDIPKPKITRLSRLSQSNINPKYCKLYFEGCFCYIENKSLDGLKFNKTGKIHCIEKIFESKNDAHLKQLEDFLEFQQKKYEKNLAQRKTSVNQQIDPPSIEERLSEEPQKAHLTYNQQQGFVPYRNSNTMNQMLYICPNFGDFSYPNSFLGQCNNFSPYYTPVNTMQYPSGLGGFGNVSAPYSFGGFNSSSSVYSPSYHSTLSLYSVPSQTSLGSGSGAFKPVVTQPNNQPIFNIFSCNTTINNFNQPQESNKSSSEKDA